MDSAHRKPHSDKLRSPNRYEALNPSNTNGFLVSMLMTPLKAPGPKYAELAPATISTDFTSRSGAPRKFPSEKFNPGLWLSTPSMSCNERTGEVLLKPRVLTILKPNEAEVKSTPFKLPSPS